MRSYRWWDHGRCKGRRDLFLTNDDNGSSIRRAKAFCAGCEVWALCLEDGLDEPIGVWGGLNGQERVSLRRLRSRQVVDPANTVDARDLRRLSDALSPDRLEAVLVPLPKLYARSTAEQVAV